MDAREWARQKAAKLRQFQEEHERKQKIFLAETELKRQRGPMVWSQLREAVQERVELFNRELKHPILEYREESSTKLVVRAGSATIQISFDAKLEVLTSTILNRLVRFDLKVVEGQVVFWDRESGAQSPETLAEMILERLIAQL